MMETVKRRRRWPWLILTVVLIAIGGPLAWRYRPLNAEEKRLVGTWSSLPPYEGAAIRTYHFADSRRYTEGYVFGPVVGEWSMSRGVLTFRPDRSEPLSLSDAIAAYKAFVDPSSTWHSVNALWPSDVEFKSDERILMRSYSAGFEFLTEFVRDRE